MDDVKRLRIIAMTMLGLKFACESPWLSMLNHGQKKGAFRLLSFIWRINYAFSLRITSVALVPPKPKLLDITVFS
ncbi:hypothetical protein EC847_102205 [Scandinavium goeteborgense]|uniref:Uncharacterized protein n=1 Tax=Scandinavium goeteborgense TaxID=1851514 RepID=A0A4R6EN49_SCAGO|nr:hypothetical protein EC847_102205 [Scandinavium goeteborgense]